MKNESVNLQNIIAKKLKSSDYEMGKTLGTGKKITLFNIIYLTLGSFGRVKIARNKITGKYNAIKILKKSEIIKLKQVDHIINEIKILSFIDHPFLV